MSGPSIMVALSASGYRPNSESSVFEARTLKERNFAEKQSRYLI